MVKRVDKEIVSIPRKERTFENTIKPLLACDHKGQAASSFGFCGLMCSWHCLHAEQCVHGEGGSRRMHGIDDCNQSEWCGAFDSE